MLCAKRGVSSPPFFWKNYRDFRDLKFGFPLPIIQINFVDTKQISSVLGPKKSKNFEKFDEFWLTMRPP